MARNIPFANSSKQITHSSPIRALSTGNLYTKYLAACGVVPEPPSKQFLTWDSWTEAGPRSARLALHTGHLNTVSQYYMGNRIKKTYSARSLSCELDCALSVWPGIVSRSWSTTIRSIDLPRAPCNPLGTLALAWS